MREEIKKIFNSSFWEDAWQAANKIRKEKSRLKNGEAILAWDRRAGHFDRKVSGDEGSDRTAAIIRFLKEENALFPGMKVLDVGCGPGSITLPLAEVAKEVYALDPSEKMLELLLEKIRKKKMKNIFIFAERWEDIDLKERGWQEAFDLSFASMSPGVSDPESLQKLIASSKKYCYLSTFAGRKDRARDELWELLSGEPWEKGDLDIIYPFNLLYTWGYRPSLRFYRHYRKEYLTPEEATEELLQYMYVAFGAREEIRRKVYRYVVERLENSLFLYEREVIHGMLIWDKTRVLK